MPSQERTTLRIPLDPAAEEGERLFNISGVLVDDVDQAARIFEWLMSKFGRSAVELWLYDTATSAPGQLKASSYFDAIRTRVVRRLVPDVPDPPTYEAVDSEIAADLIDEWQERVDHTIIAASDRYKTLRVDDEFALLWKIGYGGDAHAQKIARPAFASLLRRGREAEERRAERVAQLTRFEPSAEPIPF